MGANGIRDPRKVGVPQRRETVVPVDEPHGNARPDESSVQMADIVRAEEQFVLTLFGKLKDKRDGELRISTRRNPRTGIVEIIYGGAHEKGDLSELRRLYEKAGRGAVTF